MRFAFIILLCFIFWSSCSSHKDTINRIGDSYDKAMFNPNWETSLLSPEWYYRMTVVDTAPGSKALSVGDGHWLHPETIRFEITYDLLIGWRSQPTVPGSEAENSNYRGAPVVAFKITSHFDAARNYDPMTSAKGNLLVENTTDHGWDKRRFIKVDFSKNVVEELKRKDEGIVEMDNAFAVGKNDPSNPKRCRFEDGYFELTTRQGVQVDTYKYYGLNGEAFKMDASAPVIDLRFSFLRKPEKTNYQPLNYTDNLFDKFELKQGYRTHLFSSELTDAYAIFLTEDVEATKAFGDKYLYKCKINCKRILDWREALDIRTYEWIKKQFGNIIPWETTQYWMLLDDKQVMDYLKIRGIDCVIIDEIGDHDRFVSYAVLNPDNIQIVEVVKLK